MLERSRYFRDFFRRAQSQGEDEPFETFIFHWVAMIIGFTDLLSYNIYVNPKYKGDRDVIDDFLQVCEHVVESRLSHTILEDNLEESRMFLARRRGERRGGHKDLVGYLNDIQEELMDATLYVERLKTSYAEKNLSGE